MVLARLPSGDEPRRPLLPKEVVVARRICNAARFHLGARGSFCGQLAPLDAWRGAWQVKNCLESRGAACRRRGRLWKIEGIVEWKVDRSVQAIGLNIQCSNNLFEALRSSMSAS